MILYVLKIVNIVLVWIFQGISENFHVLDISISVGYAQW
jgi:hypothetical protein